MGLERHGKTKVTKYDLKTILNTEPVMILQSISRWEALISLMIPRVSITSGITSGIQWSFRKFWCAWWPHAVISGAIPGTLWICASDLHFGPSFEGGIRKRSGVRDRKRHTAVYIVYGLLTLRSPRWYVCETDYTYRVYYIFNVMISCDRTYLDLNFVVFTSTRASSRSDAGSPPDIQGLWWLPGRLTQPLGGRSSQVVFLPGDGLPHSSRDMQLRFEEMKS